MMDDGLISHILSLITHHSYLITIFLTFVFKLEFTMKNYLTIALAVLFLAACNGTSTAHLKSETFKVWGNCGMCKKTIEKSLKVSGIADADWNKDTKIMTVSFDSTAITLAQIQKNIAAAGYDTEQLRGDDAAYANLHSCCKYERKE